MNLLRVVIDGEENPKYCITNSFKNKFNEVDTIWWEQYQGNLPYLNSIITDYLASGKYDAVFMQIQRDGIVWPDTLKPFSEKIPIFNWTGDVRENINNYISLKDQVITLFSNSTDVRKMLQIGGKSDFLQTGYDYNYYYVENLHRFNTITFIGNHYHNHNFQNKDFRANVLSELFNNYAENTKVYGQGWEFLGRGIRPTTDKNEEYMAYNTSLLALNVPHFEYDDYYSDRLLRSMACGCCVLSKKYNGYDKEFTNLNNIVVWETISELKELVWYYINNRELALQIGLNASKYVLEKCTWDNRVDEFISLINKYKKNEFNAISGIAV